MATDFLEHFRCLFMRPAPSRNLEQALADWNSGRPPSRRIVTVHREVLDPMRGWVKEPVVAGMHGTGPNPGLRPSLQHRPRSR